MAGGAAALMDERGRMWGIPFSIVVMIIMCSSFSSWYAQPGHDDLMKKMQQKLSQLLQWCGAVQRTYAPSTVASMQMVMRFLAHWATMMKAKTRGLCAAVMRQHSLTTQPSSTSSSPLASVRQPLTKGERGSSTPARRSAHRSSAEQRRSREGVAAAITLVEEASAATPSRSSARMHQHRSSDREECVGDDATSNVVVAMRDASPAPSPIEPHTSHDARSQLPISRVAPPPPQRGCGDALPRSAWVQMGSMRMQLHPDYICVGQHLSFPLSTRMYEHRHTGVSISLSMEEVTSASHRSVMDVEGYVRRSVDRVLDRANACRTYTNVLVKTLANNVATTIFESYLEMEVGPSPIVAISFFAMMNHVAYILQLHVRQRDVEQYLPDLLMAAQTAMVEHSSPPPYSFNEFYIPTTTTTTVGGCRVAVALDFTVDQCDDRRLLLRHKFSAWEATLIVGGAPINDNTSSSSHVVRLSDAYNILLLPEMNVGMEAEARDEVMAFFMDTCVCDGIDDPVTVGHRAASHVVGEVFSLPLPPPSSIITDVCKHLFDAATTLFLQPRQPASMVKKKFADNNNNKLYRMDICFITCTAPNERGNTNTNHHHHHHTSVSSAVEALRQRLATVTAAELHHDPHMCAADDDDNDACVVLSAVERIKSTVVMVDARLADARRGNWFIAKWSYRGEEGEVLPDSLKDYRRSVLFDTVWMNPDGCWG